jgi:hypothetical protein
MSKKTKRWIYAGVVCAVAAGSAAGYARGYRLTDQLTIGKVGNLYMMVPLSHTSVFVDGAPQLATSKDFESVSLKLSPSSHTIIVSHEAYFPWQKDVQVTSAGTQVVAPIFVSQNPAGEIITPRDPEYSAIRDRILNSVLPSKQAPLVSADGTTKIWAEDNAILAEKGGEVHTVIQPDTIVKNLAFYKGRSDAVVFSTNNAVDVIEVDTEGTQNFMPIYKGQDPSFTTAATSPNFLYIEDGNTLMQVNI